MKGKIFVAILFFLVFIVGVFFLYYAFWGGSEDSCFFSVEEEAISCTKGIRIVIGFEEEVIINKSKCEDYRPENENPRIGCVETFKDPNLKELDPNGIFYENIGLVNDSYYSIQGRYRAPIYSSGPIVKLADVDFNQEGLVLVKNINTGQTNKFYIEGAGEYTFSEDNTYLFHYDRCLTGRNDSISMGPLCLPKGYHGWRCEQGYFPIDSCESYISLVKNGEAPLKLCYDFGGEITAYCLPYAECMEFAGDDLSLQRVCIYNDCIEKSAGEELCFEEYFYGNDVKYCAEYSSSQKSDCEAYHLIR